jgi:sulfur carrier protein
MSRKQADNGRRLTQVTSGFGTNSEKERGMLSLDDGMPCDGGECLDLTVQGRSLHYHGPWNVRSLLESQGENAAYANVRINGTVLGRRDFENVPLKNGDAVDFLYYMGGGQDPKVKVHSS